MKMNMNIGDDIEVGSIGKQNRAGNRGIRGTRNGHSCSSPIDRRAALDSSAFRGH